MQCEEATWQFAGANHGRENDLAAVVDAAGRNGDHLLRLLLSGRHDGALEVAWKPSHWEEEGLRCVGKRRSKVAIPPRHVVKSEFTDIEKFQKRMFEA